MGNLVAKRVLVPMVVLVPEDHQGEDHISEKLHQALDGLPLWYEDGQEGEIKACMMLQGGGCFESIPEQDWLAMEA